MIIAEERIPTQAHNMNDCRAMAGCALVVATTALQSCCQWVSPYQTPERTLSHGESRDFSYNNSSRSVNKLPVVPDPNPLPSAPNSLCKSLDSDPDSPNTRYAPPFAIRINLAVLPYHNQSHNTHIHYVNLQAESKPLKPFAYRTLSLCECPGKEHLARTTRCANLFAQRLCIICSTKINYFQYFTSS
ncbi:hypothetical protein LR48_Vigan511s003700 [Vigna angularis]|uniref:Uncharacterized protein n=1 Tax=Phaseolus angularis TaxID=3914 RepID=A0A0L9TDG7_PHAAN|nr:hypothetical protein LR48_Vigan511s003700 [Vigna angularis]